MPPDDVEGDKADYRIVQDVERQDDFDGITVEGIGAIQKFYADTCKK